MSKRDILLLAFVVALAVGLHWSVRDATDNLEQKVIYQRRLINELKADVRGLRNDLQEIRERHER